MDSLVLAGVAVQNTAYHFDKLYSYIVPDNMAVSAMVGCRVMVPFGRGGQARCGFIISLESVNPATIEHVDKYKEIGAVLDEEPLIGPDNIRLAEYMRDRTFCTLFDALKTMVPSGKVGDKSIRMVRLIETITDESDLDLFQPKLSSKQLEVSKELFRIGTASIKELCYFTGVTEAPIKGLVKKGVAEVYEKQVFRAPYDRTVTDTSDITLVGDQVTAFDNIRNQMQTGGGVSLLFGVTGSGKTSVYMKLIDEVMKGDKGVIVMVPEISLTPQTLEKFYSRYGDTVAVFHSGLSAGERLDEWTRVRKGLARIAVGTRSAVFAPFSDVGLIIMDEEQEHTYKSEMSPRYHARDIARYRVSLNGGLLLLASATPSFESFSAALSGRYTYNKLSQRYGDATLPKVEIVDMKKERTNGNMNAISKPLFLKLKDNLDNGRQSILLMNRRGYNTYAACNACGEVVTCPNCSISMTYHRANGRLMCHYCGYSVPFSNCCSSCGALEVHFSGSGTQRIEETLEELLPGARVLRMDADTTMQKYSFDEKLKSFRDGEYDIMIGTQMVAKGLDFENVTLVGVLSADAELYNDDYKSMERTFDLITQVVGRAGRGRYEGHAIIQTINPQNEVIRFAACQDYEHFYESEVTMRKAMVYPPYCTICYVSFRGERVEKVQKSSAAFMSIFKEQMLESEKNGKDLKLIAMGPMPERIVRINNTFRYRVMFKCRYDRTFRELLSESLKAYNKDTANSSVAAIVEIES